MVIAAHRLAYVIEAVVVNVLLKQCEMLLHRLKDDDRSRRTDSSTKRYCKGSNLGSDVDDGVAVLNQAKRGGEIRTLMRAKFPKIRRDEVPLEAGKSAVGSFDALGFHRPNIEALRVGVGRTHSDPRRNFGNSGMPCSRKQAPGALHAGSASLILFGDITPNWVLEGVERAESSYALTARTHKNSGTRCHCRNFSGASDGRGSRIASIRSPAPSSAMA